MNILVDIDIYGEYGVVISREECLSHVQKRIKIHLVEKQKQFIASQKTLMLHELAVAKTEKAKKHIRQAYRPFTFRDSKLVREKWDDSDLDKSSFDIELLSDSTIDKITSLYGYTIKSNSTSTLPEIRDLLLAIVYHLAATDENCSEMHQFCPEGESSWCHYRRAKFLGDPIPSHPTALSQSCKDRLIEILGPYMTLSFLDKVKAGRTSNLNESLHNVIWSFIPKTRAIDLDLMHFGSSLAVIKYNDGFAGITDLVRELGLQPSQSFIRFCSSSDNDRIDFSKLKKGKEYTKRRWSIKQSKRRRKRLGDGYKSGAYSHVSVSSDVCCMLCGGDENSGAKSNSKKVAKIDVFDWTCCDVCNSWFHNFCLNNIYGSVLCVNAEELWICPTCQRS